MNHDEATQCALGYSWGREDVSGIPTISPTEAPGYLVFAEAFAQGWDDYNSEKRCFMTNVRSAYERWQDSRGESIFEHEHKASVIYSIPDRVMGAGLVRGAQVTECSCGHRISYEPRGM